jgi:hypothetical protein
MPRRSAIQRSMCRKFSSLASSSRISTSSGGVLRDVADRFIIRNEKPTIAPGAAPSVSTIVSMSSGVSDRAHRFM